jgi:hypothetical protein
VIPLRQSDNAADDLVHGRVRQSDNSIRPERDTGFRMPPSPPSRPAYIRKHAVVSTSPSYEYVHNDDVIVVGPATLRGVPLNRVNAIAVNQESHDARERKYLMERIARSN